MTKVLGLGNALVDIMTKLKNDSFLGEHSLPKGSMQLVDLKTSGNIIKDTLNFEKQLQSGGSAANTIHGLSNLGIKTGYIGKVGNDELGVFFKNDMEKNNIEPKLFSSNTETGRAIALVSPDSERTFATYLGAAVELNADNLTTDLFKGYEYLHLEGYLIINNELVLKAVKLAKENGLKVSLDLASYNVVEGNLEFLHNLVKNYVDIVFANEEEAKAYTGKAPIDALDEIAKQCEIAIVKIGSKGSMIKRGSEFHKVESIGISAFDTTGAGDLYASGFFYGLIKGMPLDKCGMIGSITSGKVIEVLGSKMPEKSWEDIRNMISKIS
ncbi:MAG TPA: adenosine kinase [Bacteroidales bacterium]|nr:MAG: sugar kinase [Bacteroidetes bacterium GWF2_33_38]OFY91253.1 MAG: sugar kinase [Bacteroidetes bacterium RIFOXYA2_FULL_33_7]HBF87937.1 adenosine kinase [Bacteroidales bacterium]